jgi:5-formyltetrahydrofolate cyclo-ligase
MMTEEYEMEKAELRRQLQTSLAAMAEDQRKVNSRKACRHLVATQSFQNASVVMMFLSLPHEVDTSDAILQAWQLGKTVAVPKISWQQRHMIAVGINSLETGFAMGASGLRNPIGGAPIPFGQIDLVVSPALGFDRRGNRLGRGGAFYDRFFANPALTAVRCGLAFSQQVVSSIPVTESDEPVGFLVTEEGVIDCDQSKGA